MTKLTSILMMLPMVALFALGLWKDDGWREVLLVLLGILTLVMGTIGLVNLLTV